MNNLKYIFKPMRPSFLILTPACVSVGIGSALWTNGIISCFHAFLTLAGAISAHISVNAFNEYFDFKSGLDFKTVKTPFSGGSGILPENPLKSNYALYTALVTFIITSIIGIFFIYVRGAGILPLGAAGLFLIYAYTVFISRNPLLTLIAPGAGFGLLMVSGTHFVLTGKFSAEAFIVSLVPFFLVNNLLLLNQFPDIEADKTIGRKNYPILIGKFRSFLIYCLFLVLSYITIIGGVFFDCLPNTCLCGLITVIFAIPAVIGIYKNYNNMKKLLPFMGLNVLINILTPMLITIGFLLDKK